MNRLPRAMAGVAQYSDFRKNPLKRLRGTSAYVAALVFGDREAALAAVSRVKALHARVRGIDPVTKKEFSADDPETMLWVHCVEIHSFMAAYRAYAGHLTLAERDRYLAEQAIAAELIGVPSEIVPRSAFIDREAELDRLIADLGDCQKIFLISPRRYGKSSLVRQALTALARDRVVTLEITVSSFSSYVAFLEGYTRALAALDTRAGRARSWLRDMFSGAKPELRA